MWCDTKEGSSTIGQISKNKNKFKTNKLWKLKRRSSHASYISESKFLYIGLSLFRLIDVHLCLCIFVYDAHRNQSEYSYTTNKTIITRAIILCICNIHFLEHK